MINSSLFDSSENKQEIISPILSANENSRKDI